MADHSDSPSSRRFLDLATRPLESKPELQLAARTDLAGRIAASPQTTDALLEDAAAKLESADRRIWRKRVLQLVGVIAVVSLALVVGTTAWRFIQFRGFIGLVSPVYSDDEGPPLNPLAKKLPPDKRLLLLGDTNADNEAEKWKPLWESDRSNPAFLQAYAEGYLSTHKELSEELLKQAETIDPGNAYLPTLAAGSLAKPSVERKTRLSSERKSPEAPEWIIKDQERFDQAYEALRKAAALPDFTDHNITLHQQRFLHLPPGRDFLERTSIVVFTAGLTTQKVGFNHLVSLLAAKSATFDNSADIAGFQECVRLWRWLVERSAETSWTLIDGLITRAIIQIPLKNFRDAAARLGLEDASRDFRLLSDKLELEKEQRKARGKADSTFDRMIETKSSVMASMTGPMVIRQVNAPPVLTEDDFKPGRLTDHALFGQVHATITAICFCLLALWALLSRAAVPHGTHIVARRLADLVSPRDRLLLFVIGILGPLGFYFVLIQIPVLSAREWGMHISGFITPASQLAALTLLVINLTIALGTRTTRKRLPMFASARRPWRRCLPWLGVTCSMLVMLVCAAIPNAILPFGLILFIIATCWPLVFWLPMIFRKSAEPNLFRPVLHEVLAPLWISAVIISCLLFALHRSDEFKWTERDQLMAPDPEVRGMSHIEGVVAKQLTSEVRELVKALPQP